MEKKANALHFKDPLHWDTDSGALITNQKKYDSLITKVFSEVNFGRYSIPEKSFTDAIKGLKKNKLDFQSVLERLAHLSASGLVQRSDGFYSLTREGRDYFLSKKNERVIH